MKWLLTAGMAVLVFVGYIACKTIKSSNGNPVITKKLMRWENTSDPAATTTLLKDAQGRITNVETVLETDAFTFKKDSVELSEYLKAENRTVYTFKGKVDSTGKLTTGMAIVAYDSLSTDTVEHRFEYNAAGYLVKEYRNYGAGKLYTIQYEYKEGDAVKIETWYNKELFNTKELEYYNYRMNETGLEDFKFRKNMNQLAGNTSRHLVRKITSTGRHGKLNYTFNYEYETNEEGLLFKLISKKGKKVNAVTTYYYTAGA